MACGIKWWDIGRRNLAKPGNLNGVLLFCVRLVIGIGYDIMQFLIALL